MASEKSPAFQFYPKDFLTDGHVAAMSLKERGAYITLLCLCWQESSLPNDPKRLANMVGVTTREFQRVWPAIRGCFHRKDGRLIQKRLDQERVKQAEYRELQRKAGRASAAKRAATAVQPALDSGCNQTATEGQPKVNSSSPISYLRTPVKEQEELANLIKLHPVLNETIEEETRRLEGNRRAKHFR